MRKAVDYFQRAVKLDPSFALGWAGLARAHTWICEYSTDSSGGGFNGQLASARNAVARALALEPNLPEALSARAEIQLAVDFDWKGGAETLRQARELAPADPDLLVLASQLARAQGEQATATALLRQAVALDPVKVGLGISLKAFVFNRIVMQGLNLGVLARIIDILWMFSQP